MTKNSFVVEVRPLNKYFGDPDHLPKCTNKVFDVIAVSETRITKQTLLTTNINLKVLPLSLPLLNLQLILIFIKLTS